MPELLGKARTAVRDPSKVPPYIATHIGDRLQVTAASIHMRAAVAGLPRQKDLLDELRSGGEYLLIVLDACRADEFVRVAPRFFEGENQTLKSEGHDTFEYVSRCWPDRHDATYVSGAVPVSNRDCVEFDDVRLQRLYRGFVPEEHIKEIVDVWESDWAPDLGTVPPEAVTSHALERADEPQLVAHYFQPHAPYIGETKILGHTNDESCRPGDGEPVDKPIWDQVKQGRITDAELHRAYRDNLRRALGPVCALIDEVDHDRIIIMGDHGEALGEYGIYSHPRISHPHIRRIPWLEVQGLTRTGKDAAQNSKTLDRSSTAVTDESVATRLEQLGYL